jgi:hypothetical protein
VAEEESSSHKLIAWHQLKKAVAEAEKNKFTQELLKYAENNKWIMEDLLSGTQLKILCVTEVRIWGFMRKGAAAVSFLCLCDWNILGPGTGVQCVVTTLASIWRR